MSEKKNIINQDYNEFKYKPFIGPFTNFTVVDDNLKKLFDDGLGQLTGEKEFKDFTERNHEPNKT